MNNPYLLPLVSNAYSSIDFTRIGSTNQGANLDTYYLQIGDGSVYPVQYLTSYSDCNVNVGNMPPSNYCVPLYYLNTYPVTQPNANGYIGLNTSTSSPALWSVPAYCSCYQCLLMSYRNTHMTTVDSLESSIPYTGQIRSPDADNLAWLFLGGGDDLEANLDKLARQECIYKKKPTREQKTENSNDSSEHKPSFSKNLLYKEWLDEFAYPGFSEDIRVCMSCPLIGEYQFGTNLYLCSRCFDYLEKDANCNSKNENTNKSKGTSTSANRCEVPQTTTIQTSSTSESPQNTVANNCVAGSSPTRAVQGSQISAAEVYCWNMIKTMFSSTYFSEPPTILAGDAILTDDDPTSLDATNDLLKLSISSAFSSELSETPIPISNSNEQKITTPRSCGEILTSIKDIAIAPSSRAAEFNPTQPSQISTIPSIFSESSKNTQSPRSSQKSSFTMSTNCFAVPVCSTTEVDFQYFNGSRTNSAKDLITIALNGFEKSQTAFPSNCFQTPLPTVASSKTTPITSPKIWDVHTTNGIKEVTETASKCDKKSYASVAKKYQTGSRTNYSDRSPSTISSNPSKISGTSTPRTSTVPQNGMATNSLARTLTAPMFNHVVELPPVGMNAGIQTDCSGKSLNEVRRNGFKTPLITPRTTTPRTSRTPQTTVASNGLGRLTGNSYSKPQFRTAANYQTTSRVNSKFEKPQNTNPQTYPQLAQTTIPKATEMSYQSVNGINYPNGSQTAIPVNRSNISQNLTANTFGGLQSTIVRNNLAKTASPVPTNYFQKSQFSNGMSYQPVYGINIPDGSRNVFSINCSQTKTPSTIGKPQTTIACNNVAQTSATAGANYFQGPQFTNAVSYQPVFGMSLPGVSQPVIPINYPITSQTTTPRSFGGP